MTNDPWGTPQTPTPPPAPLKVFFVSPIGEEGSDERKAADHALKYLVRRALAKPKFVVERSDEDSTPGAITPRILGSIIEADVVIADLSGHNPNVFYELAVAHGHHKKTIHIQRTGERPAFDIKDMRIVFYRLDDPEKLEQAVRGLTQQVEAALASDKTVETPLTSTGRFLALDQSTDPAAEVAERLEAIEKMLTQRHLVRPSEIPTPSDSAALAEWVEDVVKSGIVPESRVRGIQTDWTSKWFDEWVDRMATLAAKADPWGAPSPAADDPWAAPPKKAEAEPPF